MYQLLYSDVFSYWQVTFLCLVRSFFSHVMSAFISILTHDQDLDKNLHCIVYIMAFFLFVQFLTFYSYPQTKMY